MKKKVVAIGLCLVMSVVMLACGSAVETSVDLPDTGIEEVQDSMNVPEEEDVEVAQEMPEEENVEVQQEIPEEVQFDENDPETWSDNMIIHISNRTLYVCVWHVVPDYYGDTDFPYGELKKITKFGLYDSVGGDLTELKYFTSLEELDLSNSMDLGPCTNLDAIKGLTNLKSLEIHGNVYDEEHAITDISALGNLSNLEYLYLQDLGCTDISALGNLTNLTNLTLDNCPSITDISALGNLTDLTKLTLYRCPGITDISALGNLTNPEYIFVTGCQSITGIRALIHFEPSVLQIQNCDVEEEEWRIYCDRGLYHDGILTLPDTE